MDCTRCHQKRELAKGKRWCKVCKNAYEVERRKNQSEEKKQQKLDKEKERYQKKKDAVKDYEPAVDPTETKVCSVCNETKTLDHFHVAKTKGTIRAMCKSCSSIQRKEYYKNNKTAVNKQVTEYQVEKMKRDPIFKLERRLRARIYQAFTAQNKSKDKRTWKYIDCTPQFFQQWIEFQLYDGMTLDNYGKKIGRAHV